MKRSRHRRLASMVLGAASFLTSPAPVASQTEGDKVVIEGYVREAGSGAPIAGRIIVNRPWLTPSGGRATRVGETIRTTTDGYYRLELERGQHVEFTAKGPEYPVYIGSRRFFAAVTAPRTQVDFELSPAVPLSGSLVDPAGRPVEGATIRIVYPDEPHPSGSGTEIGNKQTNLLGRFDLPYVKAIGRFVLEVTKPGYLPAFSGVLFGAGTPTQNLVVPVDLKRGATLRGVVLDQSGQPVQGASVRMARPTPVGPPELEHLSDAVRESKDRTVGASTDGTFSFTGLAAGPITLVALSRTNELRHQKLELTIASTEETRDVTIVLPRR